jgi:hypothetical protein
MQGGQRVRPEWQLLACLQRRREWIRQVPSERQRPLHERPQPLRRHLLAGRVDRREVGRRGDAVEVVRPDGELVPLQLPAQADTRPRLQALLEPGLVEPDGGDLIALVGDPRLHDRQVAPGSPDRDTPHFARDRGLLLGEQVGDSPLGDGRLVSERPVLEQVPQRAQAELRQLLAQRRADSRERVDRLLHALRPRRPRQARPARRPVPACEREHRGQSRKERCRPRTRRTRRFRGRRAHRQPARAA